MPQFGGKNAKKTKKTSSSSKRHFTVVMGNKEHGLYVSSTPSSAARKAVTKLCTANKSKEVEFYMREITQDSKKKTYGPYLGYIEKLKEPIELKGRVIKYKPVAKLSGKTGAKSAVKKGGMRGGNQHIVCLEPQEISGTNGRSFKSCCQYKEEPKICAEKLYQAKFDPSANLNHRVEAENMVKAKILDSHIEYIRKDILGIQNNGQLLKADEVVGLKNELVKLGYEITPSIEKRIKKEY
jgi:uncharacterized protein YdcH (DUF465 family)